MRFRIWLESNENDNLIIIPAGTTLFHGTTEEFKEDQLTVGGYDKILWMANDSGTAQSYIPSSGGYYITSPRDICKPSNDPNVIQLQKLLGIHYDLETMEFDKTGRIKSWHRPKKDDGSNWEGLSDSLAPYIDAKLKEKGFKPTNEKDLGVNNSYRINVNKGKILNPDEKTKGRLFIITTKEPLRIFDTTEGESREGDLTNVDYHNHKLFRSIEQKGYDGIKITDFAQVHEWGNIGHYSVGVFSKSISKLKWTTIPAAHVNYDKARYNNMQTDEYLGYLKSQNKNV